jgi:phosphoglycolate phosphatase
MQKKLVLFDFDGVIVNTLELCFSINRQSNPNMSFEEYAAMSHGNFYKSFEGETPKMKFNPNPSFHDQYHKNIRNLSAPEEIKTIIKDISGWARLAIVSSGGELSIAHFLENEGLSSFFSDILGYETHKSKTVKIKSLLEKYSVLPEDTVFITDTLGDILEGKEAKIQSIGVVWGLHDRETLEKGNPAAIIDNPADLVPAIEKILK